MSAIVEHRPAAGNGRPLTAGNGDAGSHGHGVLEVTVHGMTCASCAARLEKKLNQLDGVAEAGVNFATKRASVRFDGGPASPEVVVAAVADLGYQAELPDAGEGEGVGAARESREDADLAVLRHRLILSAVLSVPVILLAMVPPLQFQNWQWLSLQLATPVVLWGAWPFHRAAYTNLRHRTATMDTLISIGTLAAWGWSLAALFLLEAGEPGMRMHFDLTPERGAGTSDIYLEVAVVIITFVLAGRYFETRARGRAGAALEALLKLGAKDVAVLDDEGLVRRIPIEELRVGDRFVVRPGEKVATDGEVEEGASAVDTSLVTGESVPVDVGVGDIVIGATINTSGRLVVRATRVGSDTALAQIARLVADAQSGKAQIQRLADRVSLVFVPTVLLLSAGTFGFWITNSAVAFAFTAAVAVLIVACPCALGLATPTALLVGTGRGAQLGVLIKGPEVLESTRRIDTVVLDKTGTVTTGKMRLVDVRLPPGADREEALNLVGALENGSEHPIAQAVAGAAESEVGRLPAVTEFANHAGLGVRGNVDGHAVLAGRPALLEDHGYAIPDTLEEMRRAAQAQGKTAIMGGWDGEARVVLVIADSPKPTSTEAVRRLRALDLRPVLLTGDNEATARQIAGEVGIDEVIAEVYPDDKRAVVSDLQQQGRVVAMVGDGVNDAPALAQADLGIAIGTGTDVAIEASDLTLVSGDLIAAADAISLARRTLNTIKGNLLWAFIYNVAALPLAATGHLNPLIAGVAMASSSIFVVSNSLRLRTFKGHPRPTTATAPAKPVEAEPVDDAIEVDCWDYEAHTKTLLDIAVGHDRLERAERDELIAGVGDGIARRRAARAAARERALAREVAASATRVYAYEDLMTALEGQALLDRAVQGLPSGDEMAARTSAAKGMERAELAVLIDAAERWITRALLHSMLVEDPFLERDLRNYFPHQVASRFPELVPEHPLRRQLVAGINAHLVVTTAGPAFVSRLGAELGSEPHEVVRVFRIACEATGALAHLDEIYDLDGSVPTGLREELVSGVDSVVEAITRWYLINAPGVDIQRAVNASQEVFEWVVQEVPELAPHSWRQRFSETAASLVEQGFPEDLAYAHALQPQLRQVPDIIAVADRTARDVDEVARVLLLCSEHLHIHRLEAQLAGLAAGTRTEDWAIQAVRDDAQSARRELAQRALAAAPGAPVDEALERFLHTHAGAAERVKDFLSTLSGDGDLAGPTVAVRQLLALARS